jgi:hypothetical protein
MCSSEITFETAMCLIFLSPLLILYCLLSLLDYLAGLVISYSVAECLAIFENRY